MARLTDFSGLLRAVRSLGLPILTDEIKRKLETGDMDASPKNLVFGAAGIYSIIEREGHLFITRVILHIADYDIQWLDKRGREDARTAFTDRHFNARSLIKELHKYHFFECRTLIDMFSHGRRHRYKQSHRQDGKFAYQFLGNGQLRHNSKNQILYACRYCITKFRESTGSQVSVENFIPSTFFDKIPPFRWLLDCGHSLDTENVPPQYAKDHHLLHEKIKSMKEYRCEQCEIDLSARTLRRYAHCHHKSADKTDNRVENLECLCIRCHAEQYRHAHIKETLDYREFLPIWEKSIQQRTGTATAAHLEIAT